MFKFIYEENTSSLSSKDRVCKLLEEYRHTLNSISTYEFLCDEYNSLLEQDKDVKKELENVKQELKNLLQHIEDIKNEILYLV